MLGFPGRHYHFCQHMGGHQHILGQMLSRIRSAGLKVKRAKCQFGQTSVKFLGHIISAKGTEPDPTKIQAVQDFPTPTCLREVRDSLV